MIDRESAVKQRGQGGFTEVVLFVLLPLLLVSCRLFKVKGESEPVIVGPDGKTFKVSQQAKRVSSVITITLNLSVSKD